MKIPKSNTKHIKHMINNIISCAEENYTGTSGSSRVGFENEMERRGCHRSGSNRASPVSREASPGEKAWTGNFLVIVKVKV